MAFSTPEVYNDWYCATFIKYFGSSNAANSNDYQIHNAYKIKAGLENQGYSLLALSAVIGNFQRESCLTPAGLERWDQLPNYGNAPLSSTTNAMMLQYYVNYGVGLGQWDGNTSTPPPGQKLVSFCERYGYNWYDGDAQLFRLQREYETNIQWINKTFDGVVWTWDMFKEITTNESFRKASEIWRQSWERGGDDTITERAINTEYWYYYFLNNPDPPGPGPGPGPGPEPPVPIRRNIVYLISKKKRRISNNVRVKI